MTIFPIFCKEGGGGREQMNKITINKAHSRSRLQTTVLDSSLLLALVAQANGCLTKIKAKERIIIMVQSCHSCRTDES